MSKMQMRTEYPAIKLEQLNKLRGSSTVIVGIGNTLKGDDGLGPLICEQLTGKVSADLINTGTAPENYIQPIIKKKPQNLIIIDAIDFGGSAGEIKLFRPDQLNSVAISTHTLSPRIFVDMIRQSIEVSVYFIGIQPAQTNLGQPVSDKINQAARWLMDMLIDVFPLRL